MQRIGELVSTSEDWHPNHPGEMVEVQLYPSKDDKDRDVWVVAASGRGCEVMLAEFMTHATADAVYQRLIRGPDVTHELCSNLGLR